MGASRDSKRVDVQFTFEKTITVSPLPDQPDMMVFLYGPVVLAGLCESRALTAADISRPEEILIHDNEREWAAWRDTFRTAGQDEDAAFIPLYKVGYETYSVYFRVKPAIKGQ